MMSEAEDYRREHDIAVLNGDINYDAAKQMQSDLDLEDAESIAFRKLVYTIGEAPGEEMGPVEAAYATIEHVQNLTSRVRKLEESYGELQRSVETALAIAEQQATDGDVTKKKAALLKARNELVRRLAMDRSATMGASIKFTDVQDMLKPEVVVAYQTVKDACDELESNWACFHVGQNEDGETALIIEKDDLEESLVRAVENGLDRDDLVKRLISGNTGGGV